MNELTNKELICELRDWAQVSGEGSLAAILSEAADRLELLDERLDIVMESMDEMRLNER